MRIVECVLDLFGKHSLSSTIIRPTKEGLTAPFFTTTCLLTIMVARIRQGSAQSEGHAAPKDMPGRIDYYVASPR